MKFVVQAVLGLSLVAVNPAFAAAGTPASNPVPNAAGSAVPTPAHVKAVQDLLSTMQIEKVLRGVAGRSRYPSEQQRQAVFAKIDRTPPAEVAQRMAPPLAHVISADTAIEMTRFYRTPYGKQVLDKKYNGRAQMLFPGMTAAVAPEEKKERKRAAYVQASRELADAEPAIDHEAFNVLQEINREKR